MQASLSNGLNKTRAHVVDGVNKFYKGNKDGVNKLYNELGNELERYGLRTRVKKLAGGLYLLWPRLRFMAEKF